VSTKAITRHLVSLIFGFHASEIPELPNPGSSLASIGTQPSGNGVSIDVTDLSNP
jgi:hypothetical protein